MMKGERVLTALKVLNCLPYHAHYATTFPIRKMLHIIMKCTYLNKKKIPASHKCYQYADSSSDIALGDS
jgi:hypothetical protein